MTDWALPETAASLHSFVALMNFYKGFSSIFELKANPLRALYTKHMYKRIPADEWTDELKNVFTSLKRDVTSSPVMARYDSSKPYFLKTDWSSRVMSFILMQPDNSAASVLALEELRATGVNKFDTAMDEPCLQPINAGCQLCTESESHHHSCIGEIGAGRWGISKNKTYLWGSLFYWLCNMKSTSMILEYLGPIHALRR